MALIRLPKGRSSRALTALAAAAGAVALSASPAAAAPAPAPGLATLTFAKQGKKNSLSAQGIKVIAVGAKGGSTIKNGAQIVDLVVSDLDLAGKPTVSIASNLRLVRGKKAATFQNVTLSVGAKQTVVRGKLGGKRGLVILRAQGAATVDATSATLPNAQLRLTGNAAKAIKNKLGLSALASGKVGRATLSAKAIPVDLGPAPAPQPQPEEKKPDPEKLVDPYAAQCNIAATSKATGSLPGPTDLPSLTGAKTVVGPATIDWGFKMEFRRYVVALFGGSMQGLDGATVGANETVGPFTFPSGFSFPTAGGEYAINDPIDMTDDQAVINGSGTAIFCNPEHEIRMAISNPTIVIDGANSRIIADVDTNLSGTWTPTQRVDFATLDLSGITPFYNYSGSSVNWGSVPVTFTAVGREALCGLPPEQKCGYTGLDPINISVKTPYDASDLDALASYVATNLPFPIGQASEGGCTVTTPAGGNEANARTIDEFGSFLGKTTYRWNSDGARPAVLPTLSGASALTGGALKWGLRSGLRSTISGSGSFNLAGGVLASDTYYGYGGASVTRPGYGTAMGAPAAYFTWPTATSAGSYAANGAGSADDQLVLHGKGRVAFCQEGTSQWYGTVLSNPSVVIDGNRSRITMDVATRYRLSWLRGRVDIASLDLTSVTPDETTDSGVKTVKWTIPTVKLTAAGVAVIGMLGSTTYIENLALDGATVEASFPAGS